MERRKQLAALALVLIVVIAACVRDRERALALVTLVLALFAALMQYICCAAEAPPGGPDPLDPLEFLETRPRAASEAPLPGESSTARPRESFMAYPGAVDPGGATDPPGPSTYGHGEHVAARVAARQHGYPFDGDRFGESAHPGFADNGGHPHPCLDDDAVGGVTADEMTVYHARHRNDPRRVHADPGRHKHLADKYFREELDEEEDSHWWGRHEL